GNRMKVQVNTSNDIENKDALERWASEFLNEHLARFDQDITSIEVQLTDENHAVKGGGVDKRCMMEARINGRAPIAVTNYGPDHTPASAGPADQPGPARAPPLGNPPPPQPPRPQTHPARPRASRRPRPPAAILTSTRGADPAAAGAGRPDRAMLL